jgi:hypothetical protein
MSLAATLPGLPNGAATMFNIASTNAYGMPFALMFGSRSNDAANDENEDLGYTRLSPS